MYVFHLTLSTVDNSEVLSSKFSNSFTYFEQISKSLLSLPQKASFPFPKSELESSERHPHKKIVGSTGRCPHVLEGILCRVCRL